MFAYRMRMFQKSTRGPQPDIAGSVNVASFVLCGCPIVAKIAIPTSGAAEMADIAIR
jgi:hypothetical protein